MIYTHKLQTYKFVYPAFENYYRNIIKMTSCYFKTKKICKSVSISNNHILLYQSLYIRKQLNIFSFVLFWDKKKRKKSVIDPQPDCLALLWNPLEFFHLFQNATKIPINFLENHSFYTETKASMISYYAPTKRVASEMKLVVCTITKHEKLWEQQ